MTIFDIICSVFGANVGSQTKSRLTQLLRMKNHSSFSVNFINHATESDLISHYSTTRADNQISRKQ